MIKKLLVLSGVLVVLAAIGFAWSPFGRALLKPKRHLKPLPEEPRIACAPDQQALARAYAALLPQAVAQVETAHGRPFQDPMRIYIPDSQAAFNTYIAAPPDGRASGAVFFHDVYLSPERQVADPGGLLAHELSHLHLFQHAGNLARLHIPEWFVEGLAVDISGMGAHTVTKADGRDALRAGKRLIPHEDGGFPRPRRAADHGLNHFVFYRISQLFVAWLRQHKQWPVFFEDLLDGHTFKPLFEQHYGMTVATAFERFCTAVETGIWMDPLP